MDGELDFRLLFEESPEVLLVLLPDARSPGTPVILLTGWGARLGSDAEAPEHVDRVLGKPAKMRELRAALTDCCSSSNRR